MDTFAGPKPRVRSDRLSAKRSTYEAIGTPCHRVIAASASTARPSPPQSFNQNDPTCPVLPAPDMHERQGDPWRWSPHTHILAWTKRAMSEKGDPRHDPKQHPAPPVHKSKRHASIASSRALAARSTADVIVVTQDAEAVAAMSWKQRYEQVLGANQRLKVHLGAIESAHRK